MTRKVIAIISILLLLVAEQCKQPNASTTVPADSPNIRYTGRINFSDPKAPEFYWSGTSVKVEFNGDSLRADLRDEHGQNYFNVVIDHDSIRWIKLDSTRHLYTLAAGLPAGDHLVELAKRNEYDKGKTWFYGLRLADGHLEETPPAGKHLIEFFGNSITAGYGIHDPEGNNPNGPLTDFYPSYASVTGRAFDADVIGTVKSGIGIMVSWFPTIMPEIYNRLDPLDSASRWDFSRIHPDLVVINLFQNDSWIVKLPDEPSFKQRFGTKPPTAEQTVVAYMNFVKSVRQAYTGVPIICALGSMDATREGSPWPGYVQTAVDRLRDPMIYTLVFPYLEKSGHPRVADDQKMADQLIAFIQQKLGWQPAEKK
jgi:Carbohydrate esterase 2 N-terminal/GDSL-like Lipase/Acylhydrolase family